LGSSGEGWPLKLVDCLKKIAHLFEEMRADASRTVCFDGKPLVSATGDLGPGTLPLVAEGLNDTP